jgi:uncharacterized protein
MPELLPASSRIASPWRNGGGVTREVAAKASAVPPGFDWRISIADIDGPGPFSPFPGIDRTLVVLEGRLALAIDEDSPLALSPESIVRFSGEARVSARPLSKTSRDLNIMVRRDSWRSTLDAVHVDHNARIMTAACATMVLSLGDLTLRCRDSLWTLAYLDAVLFDGAVDLRAEPALGEAATMLVIRLFRLDLP